MVQAILSLARHPSRFFEWCEDAHVEPFFDGKQDMIGLLFPATPELAQLFIRVHCPAVENRELARLIMNDILHNQWFVLHPNLEKPYWVTKRRLQHKGRYMIPAYSYISKFGDLKTMFQPIDFLRKSSDPTNIEGTTFIGGLTKDLRRGTSLALNLGGSMPTSQAALTRDAQPGSEAKAGAHAKSGHTRVEE